jgi:hypothetical protein
MNIQPKAVLAIASVSKTNGATASGYVDTLGYKHLSLQLWATTADVVSNKPSVLKLQHSDTTDATNFADITGGIGGTDFTIPAADTTNANGYLFNVDLHGKKRYIGLAVSPRTTQTVLATGVLTRAKEAPITATKAGVLALVELA